MNSFTEEIDKHDDLTARFQHAIDNDDAEEFEALCVLAGGKPEILSEISVCSFWVGDGDRLVTAVSRYVRCGQPAEDQMSFSVGGASVERDVHMGAFAARAVAPATAPPPPPTEPEPECGSE
ncbi:hypothetical protein CYMTET_20741 [Cymbomonas tetramitiformis]|uniref:Uncharacterized protein n=1 Tax=Cymbomonas tetramitiformis TaxID=36881 RepID=A0AAE0G3J7_9CHLO|nr:hypothetical protein CYMTET_20741 [Cymbomonas tetramitiformis]